ncbi:hypothetical protein FA95DRAFT_548674 [Auriscalpium vulgare]|uniref:Uncharacterized protein n=1 Tax=Auriscalpium vulgare TaxID=40419 RepID=A0ACB8S4F6_9AGAM|nr:hypothetical protein FA95DRAFT_548674 [Auriscalpium vulgare]
MDCLISPVPQISISPAPPTESLPEPYSPFATQYPESVQHDDGYRPALLSPPPVISPRFHRQPSPLRPSDDVAGKGLERERFEALLASSRERNSSSTGKRAPDLRKEIALKTHKSKQIERRALFLSKVAAPPSPTATATPKTPPESPAIFHYSLPSPGLVSPLALFEAIGQRKALGPIKPWVEQVDFRRANGANGAASPMRLRLPVSSGKAKPMPSLDQISAHLTTHGHPVIIKDEHHRAPIALPAFLRSPSPPQAQEPAPIVPAVPVAPAPAPATKSRVPPILMNRARKLSGGAPQPQERAVTKPQELAVTKPQLLEVKKPQPLVLPPVSPRSPVDSKLQITTTVVPRSSNRSPTDLTEMNLSALNARASSRRDMISKLRRRMSGVDSSAQGRSGYDTEEEERKMKRWSAPAELPKRARHGFAHPVLALPGGF